MDIYEARRQVLVGILSQPPFNELRQAALATKLGVSPSYLTRMLSDGDGAARKRIGDEMALKLEANLGLASGTLLNPQLYSRTERHTVPLAAEPPTHYQESLYSDRVLADLEDLLPEDADKFRDELTKHAAELERLHNAIHERAEQMRKHRDYLLKKVDSKGIAPAHRVAHIPVPPKPSGAPGTAQPESKPGGGKGARRAPEPSPPRRS